MKRFLVSVNNKKFRVTAKDEDTAIKFIRNKLMDSTKCNDYMKYISPDRKYFVVLDGNWGEISDTDTQEVIWSGQYTKGSAQQLFEDWKKANNIKDDEPLAEKERKAQEWIDFDIKHYGKVSEQTKKDIKEMGLDFDKWNNQVEDKIIKDADKKDIEFIMKDYVQKHFLVKKITKLTPLKYEVEFDDDENTKAIIVFDDRWDEWVYEINGHGPISHSSYEYLISDLQKYGKK